MSKPIRPSMNPRHSALAQKAKTPAAPAAYHPQPVPKVLQRKATPTPQAHAGKPKPAPAAPPVYRPQPTPKVLQAKAAKGLVQSAAKSVGKTAPPVYRPQPLPKVLQLKKVVPHEPVVQKKSAPQAPPVYRPQPPKCLQPKMAGGQPRAGGSPRRPVAPPVYRPETKKPVQLKTGPSTRPANRRGREGRVIQRLIITSNLDTDVEYAKVKRFMVEKWGAEDRTAEPGQQVNISEKNPNEPLFILQHGGQPGRNTPGTIMGWDPDKLLEILKNMGFDPAKHTGQIHLMSCFSGLNMPGKKTDESFAARFSQLLKQKGYQGKVAGVTGSLNPLGMGGPNELIKENNLWQGDPVFTLMQEIDAVRLRHNTETLYLIQDYITGDKPEPDKSWKTMLLTFLKEALDAVEVCDQAVGLLGGFEQYRVLLDKWRDQFYEAVLALNKLWATSGDMKASELENKDDLNDALGAASSALSGFEDLMHGYASERLKQGYRKGVTGGLFKRLEMVEY